MRKGIAMVLMLIILLTSVVSANVKTATMKMDGKNVSFNTVQLKIDGQLVSSDVPPVIYNNRTLLPIRVITENMGWAVDWNPKSYEATITNQDKVVIFKVNSAEALVNGQNKKLPDNVPAKIINDRVVVPLRFLTEEMGIDIEWQEATRTVLVNNKKSVVINEITDINVSVFNNKPEIRIKATAQLDFTEIKLVNPHRLVFDFKDTRFNIHNKSKLLSNNTMEINLDNPIANKIRASQFEINPMVSRVVLVLDKLEDHRVYYDSASKEMVITFRDNSDQNNQNPSPNPSGDIGLIRNIQVSNIDGKETLVIEGDKVDDFNTIQLTNPKRLVIDVKNSKIDPNKNFSLMNINGIVMKTVWASQFTPDHNYQAEDSIVRIVVDLAEDTVFNDIIFQVNKDKLAIHQKQSAIIDALTYRGTGLTTASIQLKANESTLYKVSHNLSNNILEINVPKAQIGLDTGNMQVYDSFVQWINVEEINQNYRIQMKLNEGIEFQLISSLNTQEFNLQLSNKKSNQTSKLIVIDPGHGGKDPGAISGTLKLYESHIVLDVSQRLNKLLLAAGFRTYMTRVDDTTIATQDRYEVANQLNADLFVSVHANSFTREEINGIETLYYPSEKNPDDFRDNKKIAQIFQSELIRILQGHNRGLFQRENLPTLRETKMPAVLVEIGYLSNRIEEAKIATEEYRQKAAEAMFSAIVKYYE